MNEKSRSTTYQDQCPFSITSTIFVSNIAPLSCVVPKCKTYMNVKEIYFWNKVFTYFFNKIDTDFNRECIKLRITFCILLKRESFWCFLGMLTLPYKNLHFWNFIALSCGTYWFQEMSNLSTWPFFCFLETCIENCMLAFKIDLSYCMIYMPIYRWF